ncbi:MAG: hypothetical protein AAF614_31805 [Chloroflexota bacterium]
MAAITTFLVGAVVGGGTKWAYDKWQDKEDRPTLASAREKTADTARNFGQSVRNLVRRNKDEDKTVTSEGVEEGDAVVAEGAAA